MIACGGTGGHIYPACALAEVLKKEYPECEIRFFGSSNRMEADIIPALGYSFTGVEMSGMNGGLKAKAASVLSMAKGIGYCRKILEEYRPDICVGFGNYISVPLILAAKKLHIPTMIHEQNSFAGKANALLGRYADAVAACYESSLKQFPAAKTRILGNPQATKIAEAAEDPDLFARYGLEKDVPLAVMMMGSLGSSSVSEVIDGACLLFDPSYQVLIAVGKSNPYEFRNTGSGRIRLAEYIDGAQMLKACDAAVLRAGATTLAEITAVGTPSILIPSPYVPNNHQVFNAMELVSRNAALMIEEKDLTSQRLAEVLNDLMKDGEKRKELKKNAVSLGKSNAAYDMIEWMGELCAAKKTD